MGIRSESGPGFKDEIEKASLEVRLTQDRLMELLKDAQAAHHGYEQSTGQPDANWPEWYAKYIVGQAKEQRERANT